MCLPPVFTGTLVRLAGTDKSRALGFGHRLPLVALPSLVCWHRFCRPGTELSFWTPLLTASDGTTEAEDLAKLTALDVLGVLDLACFLNFSVLAACRDDTLVGLTKPSLFVLEESLEPLTLAFEDTLDFPEIESYTSESLLIAKFLTKQNNYTHTGKKNSNLQHLNLCSNNSSLRRTQTTTENLLPEFSSYFVCFRKSPHQIPELLQSSQRIFFKKCQNSLQIQATFSTYSPSTVISVPLIRHSRR